MFDYICALQSKQSIVIYTPNIISAIKLRRQRERERTLQHEAVRAETNIRINRAQLFAILPMSAIPLQIERVHDSHIDLDHLRLITISAGARLSEITRPSLTGGNVVT